MLNKFIKSLINYLINFLQKPAYWNVEDYFTIVRWINSGRDRSWIGEKLQITKIEGNLIYFKTKGYPVSQGYRIGEDFIIRPIEG